MAAQNSKALKMLAPLTNFRTDREVFEIPQLCQIRRFKKVPKLSCFRECLSKSDVREISKCTHWLTCECRRNNGLSPSEIVVVFQFLLWLVIRTKTQINFRFEFADDTACCSKGFFRLLDRFQWIEGHTAGRVNLSHLQEVCKYVTNTISVISRRNRLYNSLYLTLSGIRTIHWQPAFICFCSALEGLLTYSTSPGITKRLTKSYACITEAHKTSRDEAYKEFLSLYDIRSDIVHGRASRLSEPKENLKELANLSDVIRKLWRFILSNPSDMAELEGDDAKRKKWFKAKEGSYMPPS